MSKKFVTVMCIILAVVMVVSLVAIVLPTMQGRISDDSPLGKSLIGHGEGETVTLDTQAGVLKFTILSVQND